MDRVPNQKRIDVCKDNGSTENLYTRNTIAAIDMAASKLQSKGGFKLYMYIAKNANGYSFNLSSKDFMRWSGLSLTAYNTAVSELIEHRYLVSKEEIRTDQNKNNYIFYDIPLEEIEEIPQDLNVEVRKGFVF